MDETGIKFLDKLYGNLYLSDVVQHTRENSDNRVESIRKYLERLEKLHKFATTEERKQYVLDMYFDKYVIKEENIPYAFDKDEVIEAQKKKLAAWVEYLSNPTADYPMWAKYWAFQGMLKMGSYDSTKKVYLKRDKKTIAPFIEPNPEILAKSISTIVKLVNGEDITPLTEERLSKTDSFSKIYTVFENKWKKNIVEKSDSDIGVWIKYNQGNLDDAKRLSKSLENKNTGWCTADELTATRQICGPYEDAYAGGDFYVYYTKDNKGKFSVPRIAIRCIGHDYIAEIRGVLDGQNLEEGLDVILEKKLKEMTFMSKETIDKALLKVEGLRELTRIAIKTENKEPLTNEELVNLYSKRYGFGWTQDPRVGKIRRQRNKLEDYNAGDDTLKVNLLIGLPINSSFKVDDEDILKQAMERDKYIIRHASDRLRDDKAFISYAISHDVASLNFVSERLRDDKTLVMNAVNNDYRQLEFASDRLRDNEEVVLCALNSDSGYDSKQAFMYASDRLKSDKNFILRALDTGKIVIQYISEDLLDDKEIVLKSVQMDGHSLLYASPRLKDDEEVVRAALGCTGTDKYSFEYASDRLKDDKNFVLLATKLNGLNLWCVSDRLKDDEEVVINALNNSGKRIDDVFRYTSDRLKQDEKIRNKVNELKLAAEKEFQKTGNRFFKQRKMTGFIEKIKKVVSIK